VVEALFREGQVFLPDAVGMYSSQLLRGLRSLSVSMCSQLKWPIEGSRQASGNPSASSQAAGSPSAPS
jgi:hypothetical protein